MSHGSSQSIYMTIYDGHWMQYLVPYLSPRHWLCYLSKLLPVTLLGNASCLISKQYRRLISPGSNNISDLSPSTQTGNSHSYPKTTIIRPPLASEETRGYNIPSFPSSLAKSSRIYRRFANSLAWDHWRASSVVLFSKKEVLVTTLGVRSPSFDSRWFQWKSRV